MIREVYRIVCEHPGSTGYEIDSMIAEYHPDMVGVNLHRGTTNRLNTLKKQGLVRSEPLRADSRTVKRWYPVIIGETQHRGDVPAVMPEVS